MVFGELVQEIRKLAKQPSGHPHGLAVLVNPRRGTDGVDTDVAFADLETFLAAIGLPPPARR
jgi:hypothetical protein